MTKQRHFKLKSKEYFDLNCFYDDLGDIWNNEEDYNEWSNNRNGSVLKYIVFEEIVCGVFTLLPADAPIFNIDWAIDYEITKEINPEYFL